MPNPKKKRSKNKKDEKRAKSQAAQSFREHADEFRTLLLMARQEYAKGRSYDAVKMQKQALSFGSAKLPRFDDNSLVKAHALVELGLASSAVMTDFAQGDEWRKLSKECEDSFDDAIRIFEHRLVPGKQVKFRSEECWVSGDKYHSPVPHTERLGPVDYMSCANMAVGNKDPTVEAVQTLKRVILFGKSFRANRCIVQLERGWALSAEIPLDMVENLSARLQEYNSILEGKMTKEEAMVRLRQEADIQEVRHTGSRLGKMKMSDKKLGKDIDKKGLHHCSNPECSNAEKQPRQFSTCSRCKWAAYCSKECQSTDWKRHKKECKTDSAQKRAQYEEQNKDNSSLQYGQSQQLLAIVRYLHHFATISDEMMSTHTSDAAIVKAEVLPRFQDVEFGTLQLGVQDVSLVWNALWSMKSDDRNAMIQRFLSKITTFGFPSKLKGGPDFSIVSDWGSCAISGDFAVVKHTPKGSILLHDGGSAVKAYLVIGITQSIKSLLEPMKAPSPIYIRTAILPYKELIICQGTIMASPKAPTIAFEATSSAFTQGKVEIDVLTFIN